MVPYIAIRGLGGRYGNFRASIVIMNPTGALSMGFRQEVISTKTYDSKRVCGKRKNSNGMTGTP